MKCSVDYLKKETRNFDLECVFVLDLSNKGIVELDQIGSCINVEIINLSNNNVSKLSSLKNLLKLQYANLSNNNIASLEGLENLESLKSLNLSGNNIQNIEEFYKLKNLKNLNRLILNNSVTKTSNPVCKYNINYVKDLKCLLPNLEIIDGQNFKLNDEIFSENTTILSYESTNSSLVSKSESWFDHINDYSEKKANVEKITTSLFEERESFKKTYREITQSLERMNHSRPQIFLKTVSS